MNRKKVVKNPVIKEYKDSYYQRNKEALKAKKKIYYIENRDIILTKSRERAKHRKEQVKDYQLSYYFGISLDEYNKMFDSQQGCCAICGTHQSSLSKSLAVDHDHITGKVRGLLCNKCNAALGLLKDDPEVVKKAAGYLEYFAS